MPRPRSEGLYPLVVATARELADSRTFRRRTLVVAVVLLGVAAALWLAFRLRSLLFTVFVSLFVAVALEPPVHYLEKKGLRRGWATGLVFFSGFVVLALLIVALMPLFVEQVGALVKALPGYIESLSDLLEGLLEVDIASIGLEAGGQGLPGLLASPGRAVLGGLVGLTTGFFGFVVFTVTVALFSFYMVADLPKLQQTVLSFMPEEQQRRALRIWDVAVEKMGGYIYSRLILAAVSATISASFLAFLNVPFAISLGIWVGALSQLIPVVGTFLAAILPLLVALSDQGVGTMVWVLVFFVAYQQLENYVISPRITRRTMAIHPAVSVAAILAGASLLGGVGVVLALPMAGIVQAVIAESRARHQVIFDRPGEAGSA